MDYALPVMQILFSQRSIEAIRMAQCSSVGGQCTFAEHLLDGVSGDEMDQEKDEAHDEPDHRQGIKDALGDGSQSSVLSCACHPERSELE